MPKKQKSEIEILFPEIKIGGITVKPWSFGQLFDLAVILEKLFDKMEAAGISFDDLRDTEFISIKTIPRLMTIAKDEILQIVSITIGKDVKDVSALSIQTAVSIIVTIFNQNKEQIKNAFSPLLQVRKVSLGERKLNGGEGEEKQQ